MPDNKEHGNINERDVHIYMDDATGDMYIWNGSNFIKIGNNTPQIGDKGDKDFQSQEEEERKKQIEKEKEERGKSTEETGDGDGEISDEDDDYEETEEERQQRLDDIRSMLGDESIGADIEKESRQKIDKELRKKKSAEEKEKEKYTSSMQRFRESLRRFIANEVQEIRDRTFKREDPSYEGSGIIRPGRMIDDNGKIPKINVYFDQSGSWGQSDIKKGEEAIGVLNNYVKRGEITIDLYYFANEIHNTPGPCRQEGGTGAGPELIKHVISTKPDNVIVMTDSDFDWRGYEDDWQKVSPIKVKGAVWLLFRQGKRSLTLQKYLKGKKQTRVFDFR